jgi:hypothetical protein
MAEGGLNDARKRTTRGGKTNDKTINGTKMYKREGIGISARAFF